MHASLSVVQHVSQLHMHMTASQNPVDCLAWTIQIQEKAGQRISIPQYLAGIAPCPPELHQRICGGIGNASLSAMFPADSAILLRDGYAVQPRTSYSGGFAMPFESL
jgi:hypothetical protein